MKKNISITILLALTISIFSATNPFAGGSGTPADPYQISTANQLDSVRRYLSASFILLGDIDLNVLPYSANEGWEPIGKYSQSFTGTFDGKGYIIKNLYINRTSSYTDFIGLFGYAESAIIENLGIKDCQITSGSWCGGLVGCTSNCNITKCYVTGKVNGSSYVGGLVGYNISSNITDCYTLSHVTGYSSVGNLIGQCISSCIISDCYTSGSVKSSNDCAGGLIGISGNPSDYNTIVVNCYAHDSVWGIEAAGGLIGNNRGIILNSYADGYVSNGMYSGGLVGYNYGGEIHTSHAISDINGSKSYSGGLVGYNLNGIIDSCYSTGNVTSSSSSVGGLLGGGSGTIINSYALGKVSGVSDVGGLVGINYNNIWNSYAITNVYGSKEEIGGLIGANNAIVHHCFAKGSVSGINNVGGLAGGNYSTGDIDSCYATASVIGTNSVGGLVGYNIYTDIENSYSTGRVTEHIKCGGLVGYNYHGTINNCYATGSVSDSSYAGGLVGTNYYYSTVNNCYSTGSVSGISYIGGFSDYISSNSSAKNCYSSGNVSGSDHVGGFAGDCAFSTINSCFFDYGNSVQNDLYAKDLTTSQMKDSVNLTGWDFNTTWHILTDSTYPALLALDNAPFAFKDTLFVSGSTSLALLLGNDFDIITIQDSLVLKVDSLFGKGSTDSVSWFRFPFGIQKNYIDSLSYRVGRLRGIQGDTLWGNVSIAVLINKGNSAPIITSTAPTTATTDVEYRYDVVATDAEGDALSFSLENQPDGMKINDNVITWTPGIGKTSSGEVTVTVTDGELTDSETFIITVSNINETLSNNIFGINIYPNPVNNILNIDHGTGKVLKVFDLSGIELISYPLLYENEMINVSNIPTGLYFIWMDGSIIKLLKK